MKSHKLYKRYNPKKKLIILVGIVLLVYAFFFTSKLFFHKPLLEATKINTNNEYMQMRSATLYSAIYDKEKSEIELVLQLENSSGDGVNDYYYILAGNKASKKMKIEEVFNKPTITVLRIYNVPKNYRELEVYIAPKIKKQEEINDGEYFSITLNKNNVKLKNIDNNKKLEDFMKEKLKVNIENKKEDIKKIEKNIKEIKEKIANIEKYENDYEQNKNFMTREEKEKYESTIKTNLESKEHLKDDLSREENDLNQQNKMLNEIEKSYNLL